MNNIFDKKATHEDVINLYKYLLKREPESQSVIEHHIKNTPNLGVLINNFIKSKEFIKIKNSLDLKEDISNYSALKSKLDEIVNKSETKKLYQPIFGLNIEHNYNIERSCLNRCNTILSSLKNLPLENMSLLDVGCNMGFFSFFFSDHFCKTVGIEHINYLYDYCNELNKILKKKVTFECSNFFENYERYSNSFDICLLMSVIHYCVKTHGLDQAIKTLNNITKSFDITIIEMSTVKDYSFMPENPKTILDKLENIKYELIGTTERNERPIYIINRNKIHIINSNNIDEQESKIERRIIINSNNQKTISSRIYYYDKVIIKLYPFYHDKMKEHFFNENRNIIQLSKFHFIPHYYYSQFSISSGIIITERIKGILLNEFYKKYVFLTNNDKLICISKIIQYNIELIKNNIFWNDLSAHNIFIKNNEIYFIDFANSDTREYHDHIAMLTWLMHDLQLSEPKSYSLGVYKKISQAGMNTNHKNNRFLAPENFFCEELKWIYNKIINIDSISELQEKFGDDFNKLKDITAQKIKYKLIIDN